jgi:hypothetical protein
MLKSGACCTLSMDVSVPCVMIFTRSAGTGGLWLRCDKDQRALKLGAEAYRALAERGWPCGLLRLPCRHDTSVGMDALAGRSGWALWLGALAGRSGWTLASPLTSGATVRVRSNGRTQDVASSLSVVFLCVICELTLPRNRQAATTRLASLISLRQSSLLVHTDQADIEAMTALP